MTNQTLAPVRQALSRGDLALADRLIGAHTTRDPEALALHSEVMYLVGKSDVALKDAQGALNTAVENASVKGYASFIAGACSWELGDDRAAGELLSRAATYAKELSDWNLLARVKLQFLERSSDSGAPYHVSLPLSSETVRAVHRSGDRHIRADAHITFARLEARSGGIHQALRHLTLADRLLIDQPNKWLTASGRLTYATILSLQGDIASACDVAQRAEHLAADAGWQKGEAIAAANLAFFYVSSGNLVEAEDALRRAESSGYSSPSYEFALQDTRMSLAIARDDFSRVETLWEEGVRNLRGVASWYRLRGTHTRVLVW